MPEALRVPTVGVMPNDTEPVVPERTVVTLPKREVTITEPPVTVNRVLEDPEFGGVKAAVTT